MEDTDAQIWTIRHPYLRYPRWGYDQTNVEAWQVTEIIGAATVQIRRLRCLPVRSMSSMSSTVIPDLDTYTEPPEILTKRVYGTRIRLDHCSLSPWNGQEQYSSSTA